MQSFGWSMSSDFSTMMTGITGPRWLERTESLR
jgi:hypothetical protein